MYQPLIHLFTFTQLKIHFTLLTVHTFTTYPDKTLAFDDDALVTQTPGNLKVTAQRWLDMTCARTSLSK